MPIRRIVGVLLVVLGLVALAWGGFFWTDRETVIEAGPFEVTAEEREGVAVPPVIGIVAIVGGLALLLVPGRRHVP